MRSLLVAVTVTLALPVAAHAAEDALSPIVAVHRTGDLCAKAKAPGELKLELAGPTAVGAIDFDATGDVTVTADGAKLEAGHKGKHWRAALDHPVKEIVIAQAAGACVSDLHFTAAAPLFDAPPEAPAALPAALREMSAALDKCDAGALERDLVFPFVYKNAIHENTHSYKTPADLAKACAAWRKKAVDVDLDAVASPVPDAIYRRWSDITITSDGPARLSLTVTKVRRPQLWRLEWRDAKWRLLTIDY